MKMKEEQRGRRAVLLLMCLVIFMSCYSSANAYKNHSVGESTGWFSNEFEKASIDYQKWADSKSFSLGDFLVFKTDSNHSVVQTYDLKTYKDCDYNNGDENVTTEWSAANPSATSPVPVSVNVPLVKEGFNYFFSGNYDGEQCEHGQKFMINVTHGQGLPISPDDQDNERAPGPNGSSQSGDDNDETAPDTIVPANFDHPKDIESDDDDDDKKIANGQSSDFVNKYELFCLVLFSLFASLC